MNTTLHQNRPEDTQNWTNLYLEPHDYRIYYVNIDLRHQYGISVAESQTFLLAKRPQRRRARRNRCFRRLSLLYLAMRVLLSSCQNFEMVPSMLWPVDVIWSATADEWYFLNQFLQDFRTFIKTTLQSHHGVWGNPYQRLNLIMWERPLFLVARKLSLNSR